jgi:hypothetical protein
MLLSLIMLGLLLPFVDAWQTRTPRVLNTMMVPYLLSFSPLLNVCASVCDLQGLCSQVALVPRLLLEDLCLAPPYC